MPSTNGHGPKRAILYARVSTDEQARSGYSLAQQLEALRGYAASEGYEVLEEIADPGQSGASLGRPGLDRVRDLVDAGGVSVVLAQDRDRFAREPAYHYLLRREFEEQGAKMRSLNDRGDDTPEGELTDGILDQLGKYERAKLGERTRRGKLRKAREGKLLRNSRAHYGFKHDETGESYVVDEEDMRVVRRIFQAVAEGKTLHSVKRMLEHEGVLTPQGGRYWGTSFLRTLVLEDVYLPHSYSEIEALVSSAVAARLDEDANYGIFWSNRTRTTRKRVSEAGPTGREYRWRYSVRKNPREQWIAIPVPDVGLSREVVEAAREMVRDNRRWTNKGRRFFELGGILYCGACGKKMLYYASTAKGRVYSYYRCRRVVRDGKDACTAGQNPPGHRAENLEQRVWRFVSELMQDPEQLRVDLERMIELERRGSRGDPDREAEAWIEKQAEVERMRGGYQDLAAKGLMTYEELGEKLERLEDARETAEREIEALRQRQERIELLERDKDALLSSYAKMAPEALNALSPEERHQLYKMLRLKIAANPDRSLEMTGALVPEFVQSETVSR
jgi:site-specific DNA recombinase